MSMLEKMIIHGIRSFGPRDTDRQVIQFFSPITLILGQNGSGKTTIIESLRYVTTGCYPPNSTKGQTFVHDPKLSGEIEVKAQIRLQFRDVKNERRSASRSLVATQKAKNVSVNTLECYIQYRTPNGETASVTSKCADLDILIPEHLGVSKAVLNNVIFCHQEESNWPLGEGQQVKKRFDEIFSATHYISALNSVRVIRKDLMGEIKVYNGEIIFLEQNKEKAKQISLDLRNTETRLLSSRNRVKEINDRLTPIQVKLNCLSATEGEIHAIEKKLESQNTLLKQLNANKNDLLGVIQDVFVGTQDELQREIIAFNSETDKKKRLQDEAKRKKSTLDAENDRLRKQQSRLNMELGRLRTLEQQQKERINKRNDKMLSVVEELNDSELMLDSGESYTDERVSTFMAELQKRIDVATEDYQRTKANYEKQETQLQSKMDQIRDKRTQGEQKLKMNTEQLVKNKNEFDAILSELRRVDNSGVRQQELETKLKELEAEQVKLEKLVDVEQLKNSIQSLQKKKSSLTSQLNLLNQEMSKLQLESEKRTELNILEKDKTAKEELIRKITGRHEDTLSNLLGNVPAQNICRELEKFTSKLNSETKVMEMEIVEMKTRMSACQMKRSHHLEELKKSETLLSSHQDKIFQSCGSDDFEENLKNVQKTLQELQDEKGELTGRTFIYGKYVEKLEARKPCCPLCQRGFSEDGEAVELKTHIRRQIDIVPEQLKIKERHIAEQEKKLVTLLGLKPLQNEIGVLSATTIPEMKQKIKIVNEQIEELRKEINEAEETVDMKQMDLASCASIQPDMVLLNQHQSELGRLESKVADIKAKMQSHGECRTIQQVNQEREDAQNNFQRVMKEVEEQQETLSSHSEKVNSLQSQTNSKRAELLQITADQQKRQSLTEQKTKLSSEVALLEKAILESKGEIKSHEAAWQTVKSDKDELLLAKEMEVAEIQSQVDKLKNHKHSVEVYTKEIQRYIKEGQPESLREAERKLLDIKTTIDEKDAEVKRASESIQNLQKEISNQAVRERELQDNMKLKECDGKISDIQKKCQDLEKQLGNIDTTNLFKEKNELIKENNGLCKEKDQAEGRMREIQDKISQYKKELLSDQFKDADIKYKNKLIDLKTSELASDDLNKFYKALDSAVMRHHKLKMDEINKIVRELWKRTYKGHDIEYIEIRSDHTESASDKRRTYNYRVVMICGESELDMRGRCSAGQKVLASLIIRLALAETFCLNCGILALDEPTTNLDRDNIESLAYALIEVVKSRQEQRNFQLVIITHDEDFITLLGKASFCEYFWKVGKDVNAYTKLQKCSMNELD